MDCEMNVKRFKRHLRFIGRAMRKKYHWVAETFILTLQINQAGGHGIARGHGNFEELANIMMTEFHILLGQQTSGMPHSNFHTMRSR